MTIYANMGDALLAGLWERIFSLAKKVSLAQGVVVSSAAERSSVALGAHHSSLISTNAKH